MNSGYKEIKEAFIEKYGNHLEEMNYSEGIAFSLNYIAQKNQLINNISAYIDTHKLYFIFNNQEITDQKEKQRYRSDLKKFLNDKPIKELNTIFSQYMKNGIAV